MCVWQCRGREAAGDEDRQDKEVKKTVVDEKVVEIKQKC